jgi:hypothetical protein
MEKYKMLNETKNEYFELSVHEIIEYIKINPLDKCYKFLNSERLLINNAFCLNTVFICHRINEQKDLINVPKSFGIELDIRDYNNKKGLFLSHDPYNDGECFEDYLQCYKHKTLILNVKSERIEPLCIELMEKHDIKDYFFLDSNLPMIKMLNNKYNNTNIACRFSEHEPIEFYENIKHMINWVWVDCFTKQPLTYELYEKFKQDDKKICIVSPELQGFQNKITEFRFFFIENNIVPDSICCKLNNIVFWL